MFYFAWVLPDTAFSAPEHSVEDENVYAFDMTHAEGDFAMLAIDIKNPRVNFLDPSRKLWAWLSEDGTPIFYGRLIAAPEDTEQEICKMNFIARPSDFDAVKKALAETLKVTPFWDDVWIAQDRLVDPDVVLEARPQLWHIDRVTHAVTISSITAGEDGTAEFTHFYDSLKMSYGSAPLRRVTVNATASWDQIGKGSVDVTGQLLGAFNGAGSPSGVVSSFTGQGLENDWPKPFQDLNGGWATGPLTLKRVDGTERPARSKLVKINNTNPTGAPGSTSTATLDPPLIAEFFVWEFRPYFPLTYSVSRSRVENVSFTVEGDVQPIVVDPGEDESELITLSARVGGTSGGDGLDPGAIGDPTRSSFMKTDRGVTSFEYLLMLARAKLLARARAVNVSVSVPFDAGLTLTCRLSAHIVDPRLPHGEATGKIIEYHLIADGDGNQHCDVTIGCTIGEGDTIAAVPGNPTYCVASYVDIEYQRYSGTVFNVGGINYDDYSGTSVDDDGVDFGGLTGDTVLTQMTVINGEAVQREVLSHKYDDIPAAIEALNAKFTQAELRLRPLTGGPFTTNFTPVVSELMISKTIQL